MHQLQQPARPECQPGPIAVERYATQSPDQAHGYLEASYGRSGSVELDLGRRDFRFDVAFARLGPVHLMDASVSSFCCTKNIGELVQVMLPVSGGTELKTKTAATGHIGSGKCAVLRPDEPTTEYASEGRALVLTVPLSNLVDVVEISMDARLTGAGADIVTTLDCRDPAAAGFSHSMRFASKEVLHSGFRNLPANAVDSMARLLTENLANVIFRGSREWLSRHPASIGTRVVNRAKDFIAGNAERPIIIHELAASLGVSTRCLEVNFKKAVGMSPKQWLFEVRLNRARQILTNPFNKESGVTQVWLECGFADHRLFARKYREKFGELPSSTLKCARF